MNRLCVESVLFILCNTQVIVSLPSTFASGGGGGNSVSLGLKFMCKLPSSMSNLKAVFKPHYMIYHTHTKNNNPSEFKRTLITDFS